MRDALRLSELITKILNDKDLKPDTAAEMCDLHRATVYGLKSGKKFSADTIRKFVKGLKLSADDHNMILQLSGYEGLPGLNNQSLDPREAMRHIVYEMRGGIKTPETDAMARKLLEEILAEEALEHINGEPEL